MNVDRSTHSHHLAAARAGARSRQAALVRRVAAGLGALALLAVGAQAQNWPAFRGPAASGIGEGDAAPQSWKVEEQVNIRWKTPIPGLAHSSPIVWGDRVFVTTAVHLAGDASIRTGLYGDVDSAVDPGEISWRVLALDRATGGVVWDRETAKGAPAVSRHIKATHANSTPVTDGKTVVAFFGTPGLLVAYDFAGERKWQRELGPIDSGWFFDASYQWGHASSPILAEGKVILQVDRAKDSFLAAFDVADGKELWRTARPEIPSWGTPNVVAGPEGLEVVTHGSRGIRGYDLASGRELWSLKPTSEITATTPVVAHGLIYTSDGYRPTQPVYAIRPGGRGDISLAEGATSNERVAWSHPKGGTYIPTPIVVGDLYYTLNNNGTLTCYDAKTGEQLFRERVGDGQHAFSASPVASGGRLYLASEEGDVFVVAVGREYKALEASSLPESIMATPAISGDLLLVRTQKHLWGIGKDPEGGRASAPAERADRGPGPDRGSRR